MIAGGLKLKKPDKEQSLAFSQLLTVSLFYTVIVLDALLAVVSACLNRTENQAHLRFVTISVC